ncbi:thioredoxin [Bacteriovoracaceae bacterium]|nr:thioredoxin [Bacteriovoracaceae bacterium]
MSTTVKNVNELNERTNNGISVVDFYADWCGPCKALSPTLSQLESNNENLNIIKVNVDDSPELAQTYQVRGIPTLVFFKDGKVKGSVTGNISLADLQNRINDIH